jgi:DeoR/GlpR family transcriptional regulator of sugar metabolism
MNVVILIASFRGIASMYDEFSKLFVEERRDRIYALIAKNKRVTLTELAQENSIGPATIRRDLIALEQKGLVKRTHGGAILADRTLEEIGFKIREHSNIPIKETIARMAANFVSNGEALFLDGGTTTQLVSRALKTKSNLVIVTNSPLVASEIAGTNGNVVLMTGGELRAGTNVLMGPVAVSVVKQFRADHTILGMSSLIPDQGFFTANYQEAELKRTMIEQGAHTTIVMDSGKIGKYMFSLVCSASKIHRLIIDDGISPQVTEALEKQGIEVVVA